MRKIKRKEKMNDKDRKTNNKIIIVAIVAFLAGIFFGSGDSKEVEKIVEVEKNIKEWRQLKEIDDQGFVYAQESMSLCSEGFIAVSNLDVETMEEVTEKIKLLPAKIQKTATERGIILGKLGY